MCVCVHVRVRVRVRVALTICGVLAVGSAGRASVVLRVARSCGGERTLRRLLLLLLLPAACGDGGSGHDFGPARVGDTRRCADGERTNGVERLRRLHNGQMQQW